MRVSYPLLSKLAYIEHTAESFYAYIKGMLNSNTSKEVAGVSISLGKANKITIRMSREPKVVTREELTLLATEYKQDEISLLRLFIKRKIGIDYANSDKLESDTTSIEQQKADARAKLLAMRSKARQDKLLLTERDSRLHEESGIQPTEGIKELTGV